MDPSAVFVFTIVFQPDGSFLSALQELMIKAALDWSPCSLWKVKQALL
jgi:hypothetical protein